MTLDCDVVVIGAGPAGVSAALCAADAGARVAIVEAEGGLGGNVGQAFVHTICGLYHADAEAIPANPGFPTQFHAALRARGAAGAPERAGRVWVVPITPSGFAEHIDACLRARADRIELVSGTVDGAELALGAGGTSSLRVCLAGPSKVHRALTARTVVDASGDGVLGPLGGAEHERAAPADTQACSYIVRLRSVPAEATEGFGPMRFSFAVARACREGVLPAGCESVLIRPAGAEGDAYLTLGLPPLPGTDYDPLDSAYRRDAGEAARVCVERIVEHLRSARPGFGGCRIGALPSRIGVREGRRLVGHRVLSEADVLEGRRDADTVALSSWPIELWDDHRRARFRYPERACGVPLGALASRSHPSLAMAGRCVSASHAALGALRVIGGALATGAAAGRAAALAAQAGCGIAELDAAQVRVAALGDACASEGVA